MQHEISGFWRRVGAISIDAVILGVLGLLLGIFFSRQFVELGGWGRAVGFPIAAIYFVVLNSRWGNGQTVGKRAVNIQVVGRDGKLISPAQSFVRYSVLAVPYFLNGAQMPEAVLTSFAVHLLAFFVLGLGLSIIYLIVFNRNTRQSLHDFMAGTLVVRPDIEREQPSKPVWIVHYLVCGILLAASLLLPVFFGKVAKSEVVSDLLQTREQIQHSPRVVFATIQDGTSTFKATGGVNRTTTYISTQVFLRTDAIEDNAFAERIAGIVLGTYPDARQRNLIQVVLTHGYDIGISSFWKRQNYKFSPAQLAGTSDPQF